jgi:hypothetical protein
VPFKGECTRLESGDRACEAFATVSEQDDNHPYAGDGIAALHLNGCDITKDCDIRLRLLNSCHHIRRTGLAARIPPAAKGWFSEVVTVKTLATFHLSQGKKK